MSARAKEWTRESSQKAGLESYPGSPHRPLGSRYPAWSWGCHHCGPGSTLCPQASVQSAGDFLGKIWSCITIVFLGYRCRRQLTHFNSYKGKPERLRNHATPMSSFRWWDVWEGTHVFICVKKLTWIFRVCVWRGILLEFELHVSWLSVFPGKWQQLRNSYIYDKHL
jgi:hypothetical protein